MQSGVLAVTKIGTVFGLKQVVVPVAKQSGLSGPVDPFFDPNVNPWWGFKNARDGVKEISK
ncbi:hypothetical protein [Burkholderia metallica]